MDRKTGLQKMERILKAMLEVRKQGQPDRSGLRQKVFEFVKGKPSPIMDKDFHAFAEQAGIEPDELEGAAYDIISELVNGGKSKGEDPAGMDPEELRIGIEVESEHVACPEIQRKIAVDHLTEDPQYYSKLAKMEAGG
jgi:hypothetical protein